MRSTIIMRDDEIRGLLDGTRTQLRRPVKLGRYILEERDDGSPWPWLPEYVDGGELSDEQRWMDSTFGATGSRLAVREAWAEVHPLQVAEGRYSQEGRAGIPGPPAVNYRTIYRADGDYHPVYCLGGEPWPYRRLDPFERDGIQAFVDEPHWLPSISMPRWACRYALEVGEVRCQRLQDATEDDAIAEGVTLPDPDAEPDNGSFQCHMCGGTMLHAALGHNYGVYERDCDTCDTLVKRLGLLWQHRYGKRYPCGSNPWTFVATGRLVAL